LRKYLLTFLRRFNDSIGHIRNKSSIIDRFETTGVIEQRLVGLLNLTGPIARACNAPTDARIDQPYCHYKEFPLTRRLAENGDVFSRFNVKASEIVDSVEIIISVMNCVPEKEKATARKSVDRFKDGYALSVVEAPRGQNLQWVYIRNGKIYRLKARTASFCNWQAIEHAVIGNIVPDFPLINKSLNLSYAGTDL
jgi:formate hydrogenlyase subunit 5